MKKTKKHSCECEMNEDVANIIHGLIPEMSKNIHEGMFRGIGQRAKLLGQQAYQMGREAYYKKSQDAAYQREGELSSTESSMIHPIVAKKLGLTNTAVRQAMNDPSNALHGDVHRAISSDAQLRRVYGQVQSGRQRNIRSFDRANTVLSSQISTPQQQANLRNQQATYAANWGRPFDPNQFNAQNPVNPRLYRTDLGAQRQNLRTARTQQIDTSIQQGVAQAAFTGRNNLRSRVSRVLANSPRLTRIFKAVDTII